MMYDKLAAYLMLERNSFFGRNDFSLFSLRLNFAFAPLRKISPNEKYISRKGAKRIGMRKGRARHIR